MYRVFYLLKIFSVSVELLWKHGQLTNSFNTQIVSSRHNNEKYFVYIRSKGIKDLGIKREIKLIKNLFL